MDESTSGRGLLTMDGHRGNLGASLEISVEQPSDGVLVITPAGELDLSNGELLQEALTGARGKNPTALVIDLSSLRFMDSSGLRILLDTWNEATVSDLRMALVVPAQGLVRRVLEISGCDGILPIVARLADAL